MKKCKFLAALLALVLIFGSLPVLTLTASAAEAWTAIPVADQAEEDGNAGITTYGEFAYAIQSGKEKIELAGNIDLGGNTLKNANFGTLKNGMVIDGKGYSIVNFTIDGSTGSGLFGVEANAKITIQNLNVGTASAPITGTFGDADAGVLIAGVNSTATEVGYAFDIKNVHVYASITTADGTTKHGSSGGFIGWATLTANSTIQNSSFNKSLSCTATITSTEGVGGLIGTLAGAATLTITNCVNRAAVTGAVNVGGFVGNVNSADIELCIYDSINQGAITGQNSGGFIGYNLLSKTTTVTDCVNTANIKGNKGGSDSGIGGLIGKIAGLSTVTLSKCANLGAVTMSSEVTTSQAHAGGLIGSVKGSKTEKSKALVADCIVVANVTFDRTGGATWSDFGVGYANASYAEISKFSNFQYMGTLTGKSGGTASLEVTAGSHNSGEDTLVWGVGTELKTKDAAVDALNALGIVKFYLDGEAIKIDLHVPQMVGVQVSADKSAVRFVAVLKETDLAQYQNLGFKVTPKQGETTYSQKTLESKVVLNSLNAKVQESDSAAISAKTYTATDLGGAYIMALAITGVPTTGTVVFIVQPYVTNTAVGATPECGTAWELTFVNGAFSSATPVVEPVID